MRLQLRSSNINFVGCRRYWALLLTRSGRPNTAVRLAITGIRYIWETVRRLSSWVVVSEAASNN